MIENVDVPLSLPGDADPTVALLLGVLEETTAEWKENLGTLPDEALLWQPFPGGHSIGAILLHIAEVEVWWLHEVGAGIPLTAEQKALFLSEEIKQYEVSWPIPPAKPLAWYFEQLDTVRAQTRELAAQWRDPTAQRPENGPVDHSGKSWKFTVRWLLGHVITHEAYHGGQAVLLSLQYTERMKASEV